MNSPDEDASTSWNTRELTPEERIERSVRQARISHLKIRYRKIFGLVVWAVTFAVALGLLAIPSGNTTGKDDLIYPCPSVLEASGESAECANHHIGIVGEGLLIVLVGLVLGIVIFVPGRQDILPEP